MPAEDEYFLDDDSDDMEIEDGLGETQSLLLSPRRPRTRPK